MRTSGTGLTYTALGVAALFAIATVIFAVWGVMQRQAIDEERAAQVDLRRQLDVLESSPSMWPQLVDLPLASTPTPPSYATPEKTPTPAPVSEAPLDPFWALSGDPAIDEDLLQRAMNRCEGEGYIYDEIELLPVKRVAMDKLKQRFYAKQLYIEQNLGGDADTLQKQMEEMRKHLKAEQKALLASDEWIRWRRLEMKDIQNHFMEIYTARMDGHEMPLSPSSREHVITVLTNEHMDAFIRIWDAMPDDDQPYIQNLAAQSEAIRCAREKLAPALSPEDMESVNLMLDQIMDSMNTLGDYVSQSMDRQQQSSP